MQVTGREAERSDVVVAAERVDAVASERAGGASETVKAGERQAREVRARVLYRVVDAHDVGHVVDVAWVVGKCAHRERACLHGADRIDDGVVLSPEGHVAERRARQPDIRLPSEERAALLKLPGPDVEAAFHDEDGLVAAAQILVAAQAPARCLQDPARHRPLARAGASIRSTCTRGLNVVRVVHAFVEQAVERDAALCEGRAARC